MAQITKSMIDMYIGMVKDEFKPVIDALKSRTDKIKNEIEDQVKKELGYYELEAQKAALELKLTEVRKKLWEMKGGLGHHNYDDHYYYNNNSPMLIETETERRLKQVNQPLVQAESTMNDAIKKVKLMSCGKEFANVMASIADQVDILANNIAQLPPIEEDIKQITA
jgi:Mg2+ and Co2+ transporter CorA